MRQVARRSLVDQAIAQMRQAITSNVWQVGQRIPSEPELVSSLGVARNTVREAVRALAHAGVLEVRHGDGTFVRARDETQGVLRRWLDLADLLDVLVVRRGLEVEAARQAAHRATSEELAELDKLRRQPNRTSSTGTAPATTRAAAVESALSFHTAVVRASHNPVLIGLYDALAEATEAGMRRTAAEPALPDDGDVAHRRMLAAIHDGDAERAAQAAARHLDALIDGVRRRLDS